MYASQTLCEELYKVSGWEEETFDWWGENKTYLAPRYSLGYLLRKLPPEFKDGYYFSVEHMFNEWQVGYQEYGEFEIYEKADTPEDAACKLAIELFKKGILK